MKVALIFDGNINYKGGKFNHVFSRYSTMKEHSEITVDIFFIQKTYSKLFNFFKKVKTTSGEFSEAEGFKMKNLWIHMTLWDFIKVAKLKLSGVYCKNQIKRYADVFKEYDILSTNDSISSYLGSVVKKKYGIPFVITWHGSDINVYPHQNKKTFELTRFLITKADYNLFVSKNLLKSSENISRQGKKTHLYPGIDSSFYKKSCKEKNEIRDRFSLDKIATIGFVGNVVPVKNVLVLPDIFSALQKEIERTQFLIVGDGMLLQALKDSIAEKGIKNIFFTGSLPPSEIPDIMNVLDILILPSKNEGLGLVCIEAQACGVNVVGSKVGGIPEIIGEKNSICLDDEFVEKITTRIIEIIQNKEIPLATPEEFDLVNAVEKEIHYYKEIVKGYESQMKNKDN